MTGDKSMLLWNYDGMVENIQIATKGVDDEKGKIG
jgi:hypothetical protein